MKQTSTYSHQLANHKKQGTHTSQDSHVPLDSLESKLPTIDFGASPDCFTSVLRQSITWLEQVSNPHKSANPYLEPIFLKVNPSKQGFFKPKEGSFGFQVYNIYSFFSMGWRCGKLIYSLTKNSNQDSGLVQQQSTGVKVLVAAINASMFWNLPLPVVDIESSTGHYRAIMYRYVLINSFYRINM